MSDPKIHFTRVQTWTGPGALDALNAGEPPGHYGDPDDPGLHLVVDRIDDQSGTITLATEPTGPVYVPLRICLDYECETCGYRMISVFVDRDPVTRCGPEHMPCDACGKPARQLFPMTRLPGKMKASGIQGSDRKSDDPRILDTRIMEEGGTYLEQQASWDKADGIVRDKRTGEVLDHEPVKKPWLK